MAATISHSPATPSQLAPWSRTLARLDAIHSSSLRRDQLRRMQQQRRPSSRTSNTTSPSSSSTSAATIRAVPSIPKLVRTQSTGISADYLSSSSSSPSCNSSAASSFSSISSISSISSASSTSASSKAAPTVSGRPRKLPLRRPTPPSPSPRDPLSRLPLTVITTITTLLEPEDVITLQRVSKTWKSVLASEYVYTVALMAHFAGTEEEKGVRERHEGGEKWPEESVDAYRGCCKKRRIGETV